MFIRLFSFKVISIYAVVKGYHVYGVQPKVDDVLTCEMEPENRFDPRAVKVLDSIQRTVGYVPAIPIPLNEALFETLEKWPGLPLEWYLKIFPFLLLHCYILLDLFPLYRRSNGRAQDNRTTSKSLYSGKRMDTINKKLSVRYWDNIYPMYCSKFKTLGAIFSAPDTIFCPKNAPDAFSAPIGKFKKTPRKNASV